jgi:hypothetical protein
MQKWSECGESFNGTLDDVDVEHHEYHPDSDHVFEFKRLNLQYLQVSARWADAATA